MKGLLTVLITLLTSPLLQAHAQEKALKKYNQAMQTLNKLSANNPKDGICANEWEETLRARLCSGDAQAVCENWAETYVSRDAILKPALAVAAKKLGVPDAIAEIERTSETWFTLFDHTFTRPRSSEDRYKSYFYLLSAVQDQLLARLEKIGITKDQIEAKFKEMKEETAFNLSSTPTSFELLDLDRISLSQPEQLSEYYKKCGIDGLEQQAVFDGVRHKVILCPGFLYLLLRRESFDSLTHALGHEIGHGAFFLQSPKDAGLEQYLGCVDKYYGKELTTQKSASEYIEKTGFAALKKKIQEFKAAKKPDLEKIRHYQRSVEMIEADLKEARLNRNPPSMFGLDDKGPAAIETNAGELMADWSVADVFGEEMRGLALNKRLFKTINTFNPLCQSKATQEKLELLYGPKGSEGVHPRGYLRIELSLKNPKIQKALGCGPLADAKRPGCHK